MGQFYLIRIPNRQKIQGNLGKPHSAARYYKEVDSLNEINVFFSTVLSTVPFVPVDFTNYIFIT